MKYSIQIITFVTLLFAVIISCTKEVELKTEVEFDVAVEHSAEGYTDEALSTIITVVPEEVLEEFTYSYSYSVSKGDGYFTDRTGEILPMDENIALDPLSVAVKYIGTAAGDHIVKVTGSNNYGFSEEVEIAFAIAEIPPVVWTAISPVTQIELGRSAVVFMNFEKSTALADVKYERQYRIINGTGRLTDAPKRDDVALDTYEAIAPGAFQLNFTPAELGTAELSTDLQGDDGSEFTAEIVFEVVEDIVDNKPPEITLKGDNPYIVQRKTAYIDPGATALDEVEGDISEGIVLDTTALNMARTGTYIVTYNITDSSNQVAKEVSRTVQVVAGDNPESVKNDMLTFAILGQTGDSRINEINHTIAIDVPYGTELKKAPSALTISDFATVTPSMEAQQDFGASVVYTVKAENDIEQEWTVKVTVGAKPIIAPVVEAGDDILITLPTYTFNLKGSASDADGTFTTEWTLESGDTAAIADPTLLNATVSVQAAGTYVFRLTATDDDGATDTDTVTVTVNSPPTVDAGTVEGIQLPVNDVVLTGSASDVEGAITTRWTKRAGGAATIADDSALRTRVTGLVAGTYTFRLTATDSDGASTSQDVTFTVKAANIPPTVNPGPDQNIQLPTNSVSFAGSTNDADGTVTVEWTKVNGGAATISDPNSEVTSITGLTEGEYLFMLTGTDNDGASASETVKVTVEAANIAPTVNAGANRTLTLTSTATTISVDLSGSANDADGTITTLWSKRTPSTTTIQSPTFLNTRVSGLTQGGHTFRLTVTDNDGATAYDDVTITVRPYSPPVATISYNPSTGVYTAPRGSSVTVNLTSEGMGKGSASISGSGSASNSWNGLQNEEFVESDTYYFTMPSSGSVTFTSRHSATFGTSSSRVRISNNQGATQSFSVANTNGIP